MATVRKLTRPPNHHFFGYYEKSPWDRSERHLLAHRVSFDRRQPTPKDSATICLIDADDGAAEPIGETTAWNFQQGSMLQWLGPGYDSRIIFNDRHEDGFISRILDVESGEERTIERPIYAVSPDGATAYSVNFARLDGTRPGYGYATASNGVTPPSSTALDLHPDDDGVFSVDLESNESNLLVSLAELAAFEPSIASEDDVGVSVGDVHVREYGAHWVNHVQIAPDGDRLAFIHRAETPGRGRWHDRLFVVDADGGNLRCISEGFVSHYDWRTPAAIVAWTREGGRDAFHRYDLDSGSVEPVAPDLLPEDGHNSFSSDGRFMLCDAYPDEERRQHLFLYDTENERRIDLARFDAPPVPEAPVRCDLHPRWNRSDTSICVDSTHDGTRQLYVVDVSEHTASELPYTERD